MNRMKVPIFLAPLAALVFALWSCGGSPPPNAPASSEFSGPEAATAIPAREADGGPWESPLDAGAISQAVVEPYLEIRPSADDTGALYGRIIEDLRSGKPLVLTAYVALCDNDSQGIVPVRNRSICDGDHPMQNMYWAGRGALSGVAGKEKWKNLSLVEDPDGVIMIEQVWQRWMHPGEEFRKAGITKPFSVNVIGRAYRGKEIHRAFVDYLHAVHHDEALEMDLEGRHLVYGGAGHLVGYVGHDYMMDVMPASHELAEILEETHGESSLAKGVFGLACAGDSYIRPFISRPNVYILALNIYLAFPNAWTIDGILSGVAAGEEGRGIHRSYAGAFAKAQKCGMRWARKAFAYGPQQSPE